MEVYRRPTVKNILLWDQYIQKKNLVHQRGTKAIQAILAKHGQVTKGFGRVQDEINAAKPIKKINRNRFRFIFYFAANCSACKSMYASINELVKRGYYVEAVRVDKSNAQVSGLAMSWDVANKKEIERLKISATPLLVVLDKEKEKLTKINGYQSVDDIFRAVNSST